MKEAITLVLSVWNYCCGHRPHLLDLFAISQKEKMRHIYFPSNSQQQEQRNSLLGKYQFFPRAFSASQKSRKCPSHFSKWSPHSFSHYWKRRALWLKFTVFDPVALHILHRGTNSLTLRQNVGNFKISRSKDVLQKKFPSRERAESEDILN